MTMPRELTLRKLPDGHRVASQPARELRALQQPAALQCVNLALSDQPQDFSQGLDGTQGRFLLCCSTLALRSFTLTLGNPAGDRLDIGYQADANGDTGQWWIDRRHSGDVGFHPALAGRHSVPRLLQGGAADLALWFDAGSVELFADGGLSTLTSLFFAQQPWSVATVASPDAMRLDDLQVLPLRDPR
jgi:fructan beta-fructosidase